MHMPFSRFRRARHTPLNGPERIRSIFSKFKRIQKLNTNILERIAEMDRALGGEYIFDRAFLESSVHELSDAVYQVVYSLNALSQNEYPRLFDRFQTVKDILDDILRGGAGPFASSLVLAYPVLGWEMEPLVGMFNICLAEARHRYELCAPDGFAVTAAGCRLFFEENGFLKEASYGSDPNAVKETFSRARIPTELENAIQSETQALLERCGSGIRLSVRVCPAGGLDMGQHPLVGIHNVSPRDILDACKLELAEYASRLTEWNESRVAVALGIHETVPVSFTGKVSTVSETVSTVKTLWITAAPEDHPEEIENYWVSRSFPYNLLQSDVLPKASVENSQHRAKDPSSFQGIPYRGSAWMEPSFLQSIALSATTIERMLGFPFELRWGKSESEKPVILDIYPMCQMEEESHFPEDLTDILRHADLLLQGGETAQAGIAYGRVVHVSEIDSEEDIPYGAIAVTRKASPQFSSLLRRVSALITEIGTPGGHLATIAREMRVPAIFGATDALKILRTGWEVTVDAGERSVYKGRIEPLLSYRSSGAELCPTDPEYVVLRGLLRWIMPLNLIDPESQEFSIENCRTYHDIIHFAHERSIEELIHVQSRKDLMGNLPSRRLELDIPMEIHVLQVDGETSLKAPDAVRMEEVTSEPLLAFLEGLSQKDLWNQSVLSLKVKDIFSGIDRTYAAIAGPPEHMGRNLAIIASEYMNLSLHLGYHSSIVDTYLSDNPGRNYIYFRFVGGFADERRRVRRVNLIQAVLEKMGFKMAVKGDLLVANLRMTSKEESVSILESLGGLTAFTRQLDVTMVSENRVEDLVQLFLSKMSRSSQSNQDEETEHEKLPEEDP